MKRIQHAEIERLRAALEKIASCDSHHPGDVVAIARLALTQPHSNMTKIINKRPVSRRNAPPSASLVDITRPETVEVQISADAKTLWVNIDGICALRACRCENIVILNDTTGVNEVCFPYRDPQPPSAQRSLK